MAEQKHVKELENNLNATLYTHNLQAERIQKLKEENEWLINRVEELENQVNWIAKNRDLATKTLDEQNQHYKQYLEKIAKELYLEGDSELVTQNKLIRVIINAREALKGVITH